MGIRPFQDKAPALGERVYVDPASTVIGEVTLGNDDADDCDAASSLPSESGAPLGGLAFMSIARIFSGR